MLVLTGHVAVVAAGVAVLAAEETHVSQRPSQTSPRVQDEFLMALQLRAVDVACTMGRGGRVRTHVCVFVVR